MKRSTLCAAFFVWSAAACLAEQAPPPVDMRERDLKDAIGGSPKPVCPGPQCPSRSINPGSGLLAGGPVRVQVDAPPSPSIPDQVLAAPQSTPSEKQAAPAKPTGFLARMWYAFLNLFR